MHALEQAVRLLAPRDLAQHNIIICTIEEIEANPVCEEWSKNRVSVSYFIHQRRPCNCAKNVAVLKCTASAEGAQVDCSWLACALTLNWPQGIMNGQLLNVIGQLW